MTDPLIGVEPSFKTLLLADSWRLVFMEEKLASASNESMAETETLELAVVRDEVSDTVWLVDVASMEMYTTMYQYTKYVYVISV